MIRVKTVPEPKEFDLKVRKKGNNWIKVNQGRTNYPSYWIEFRPILAEGFENLCGYTAMWLPPYQGQVDHFIAQKDDSKQVYEWHNYRYISPTINAAKKPSMTWLDPYKVQDNWFELDLLTLELRLTDKIPDEIKTIAKKTLERLKLNGTAIIRQREAWYEMYQQGLPLEILRHKAPLIAKAIDKEQDKTGAVK